MKNNPFEKILNKHINIHQESLPDTETLPGDEFDDEIENREDILYYHTLSNRAEALSEKEFNEIKTRLAELEDENELANLYDEGTTEDLINSMKKEIAALSVEENAEYKENLLEELESMDAIVNAAKRKESIVDEIQELVKIIQREYLKRERTSDQKSYLN